MKTFEILSFISIFPSLAKLSVNESRTLELNPPDSAMLLKLNSTKFGINFLITFKEFGPNSP